MEDWPLRTALRYAGLGLAFTWHFILYFALLFLLYPGPVGGAEPHSHEDAAGKFYANWTRPDNRSQSCCNKFDCYSTQFKNEGGTWFYLRREDAQWLVIPHAKLEHNTLDPRTNPDGQNHVCASPAPNGVVYCAIIGGMF